MGRTSRYSRNSWSSASVSNFSISSSLIRQPLWLLAEDPNRPLGGPCLGPFGPGQGLEPGRDLAHAEERPAMDRAGAVLLERVPVLARPVAAVRVEPVR